MRSLLHFGCRIALFIGAANLATAAITVNGLTDRTRYDGSVTFTVMATNGFDTSAVFDGQPLTVGTPNTVTAVQYHELVVSQQPSGGGTNETARFQFIVRNSERISTEDGIPTFTPPPLVDDAPSAFAGGVLTLVTPRQVPMSLTFPMVALLRRSDGSPLWLNGTVQTTWSPSTLRMFRGAGSTLASAPGGTPELRTIEVSVAGLSASVPVEFGDRAWTNRGGTVTGLEDWGANACVYLTNSLTIPTGAQVRIGAGSVVLLAAGVEIIVDGGALEISGTLEDPVLFAPSETAKPWGGIRLTPTAGSRLTGAGALFTQSGADPTWFNTHSGYAVHRREQACVLVDTGAQALLTNCFFVQLAGQAFHLKSGTLSLTDCLVQRATTVGELTGGMFTALRCNFSEFPDTSSNFVDGDNDALYLVPGTGHTYTVEQCAIGITKDDGVDTGAGHIVLRHCWVENCFHEGTSPSTGGHQMDIADTVFTHCGQGVEQGFGTPMVNIGHSAMIGCMNGIRSGDNYSWDYSGVITATNSLSLYNDFQDVWGYEWASWTYRADRMDIVNNLLTTTNTWHPTNQLWNPEVDGVRLADFMPVPNSKVGVAITGAPSGSLFDYQDNYEVRLSTFSALPVSVDYALTGKAHPAATEESTLASGTLHFAPGETRQTLNLALPGIHAFGFLRLALSQTQNAEITGPELVFIATDPAPPDAVLIPRGAGGWSYQALRVEPPGAWEAYDAEEPNWVQNATAPIGFGNIGAPGAYVTLGTTLNATEQGPDNDRTRAVYFRRHFAVSDPAAIRELKLSLMRDDGAVVYLNGTEMGRENIDSGANPGGTITYSTTATRTIDLAEESLFVAMPVSSALVADLRPGDNVIALEMHQASATSSDLVMDLELTASFHPPVNNVQGAGRDRAGAPFLYWFDDRWVLQRSTNLVDWTAVPAAASPWKPALENREEFYRWRR